MASDVAPDASDDKRIVARTLEHYNARAAEFWEGTRGHDVTQNIAALLTSIEAEPPFTILDFGCGPGRDLGTFARLGHVAIGLEGAARFAAMARAFSGCEVWQQDFLQLDLPAGRFDGVFANASLFHVPSLELPRAVARAVRDAEARRRAVQFESARAQRGGLEPRALWRLPRSGNVVCLRERRGLRRSYALLSPRGLAAGATALARHRRRKTKP